jgi:hypothetical protein
MQEQEVGGRMNVEMGILLSFKIREALISADNLSEQVDGRICVDYYVLLF